MTEADIRRAVQTRLSSSQGAVFISELFIDGFARRADLVVANGKLSAFEFKSERDKLDRLPGQLQTYCRFFEEVTVVCAERHLQQVLSEAPNEVGVWAISSEDEVRVVRRPERRAISCCQTWSSFLPVDELRQMVKLGGNSSTGTRAELSSAARQMPVSLVRRYVLSYLKRRHERINAIISRRNALRRPTAKPEVSAEQRLQEFLRRAPSPERAIARQRR